MLGKAPARLRGRRAGLAGSSPSSPHRGIPPWLPARAASPHLPSPPAHSQQGAQGQEKGDARDPIELLHSRGRCNEKSSDAQEWSGSQQESLLSPPCNSSCIPSQEMQQPHSNTWSNSTDPSLLHWLHQTPGKPASLSSSDRLGSPQLTRQLQSTLSSPQNLSSALPPPLALAEPRISTLGIPVGRIKAGPRLDHGGEGAAAGCTASGAAAHLFPIVYPWAAAHGAGEGHQRHCSWLRCPTRARKTRTRLLGCVAAMLAAGLNVKHLPLEEPRHKVGALGREGKHLG